MKALRSFIQLSSFILRNYRDYASTCRSDSYECNVTGDEPLRTRGESIQGYCLGFAHILCCAIEFRRVGVEGVSFRRSRCRFGVSWLIELRGGAATGGCVVGHVSLPLILNLIPVEHASVDLSSQLAVLHDVKRLRILPF